MNRLQRKSEQEAQAAELQDFALVWARESCSICHGAGWQRSRRSRPCRCIWQRAFRVSLAKYQAWLFRCGFSAMVYRADFDLAGKRELSPVEYEAFRAYFILEAGWKHCARRLGLERDKAEFYRWVYRAEIRVGRALVCRGVFPHDEYFNPGGRIGSPRGRWGELTF